jgi:hypothetical protein
MKKSPFTLLFVLVMVCSHIHSQQFTLLQINQVNTEVNRMLQVFSKYSAYTPGEVSEQKTPTEFLSIFRPEAQIFNFLEPDAGIQTLISPTGYYQYIRKHYNAGLNFEMTWDAGKMSRPMPTDDQHTGFVSYIPVSVKAIGLFDGQMISNFTGDYYAIIGFQIKDGQITDVAMHYLQAEKPILKFGRKAEILVGLYAAPDFTRIFSNDIFNDEIWDAWGEFGYRGGLKILYRRGQNLGFFGGAGISYYKSVYEIKDYNNESFDKTLRIDIDGDEYLEYITASVTETNSLTFLDIPLGIRYSTKGSKVRLVVQAGLEFSFLLSSRFSVTGNSDHQGYYPEYHVVLYDLPDYGFTAGPVDINDKWKLNPFNLSANFSAGAEFSINKNVCLTLSPFATAGITDLGYETPKHRDDYISISGNPGKLSTRSAGILVELFFKL